MSAAAVFMCRCSPSELFSGTAEVAKFNGVLSSGIELEVDIALEHEGRGARRR
jgi:hypothetical protein